MKVVKSSSDNKISLSQKEWKQIGENAGWLREAITKEDVGHFVLDVAGLIPGYGEVADLTNAIWYATEGNYLFAAFSLISCIPELGDLIGKGGKVATWISKNVKYGDEMIKYAPKIAQGIKKFKSAIKLNWTLIEKLLDKAKENDKIGQFVDQIRNALRIFANSPTEEQSPAEGQDQGAKQLMETTPASNRIKVLKTSSGKVKLSKKHWKKIGLQARWIDKDQLAE